MLNSWKGHADYVDSYNFIQGLLAKYDFLYLIKNKKGKFVFKINVCKLKKKVILMIYYKNNQWHMCDEKVKYIQHGEEITQYVGSEGHGWWVDFANTWEHTEIIEFIDVVATNEQLSRLEEINNLNISDGYSDICSNYVELGQFPEELNNPLRQLQLKKENDILQERQQMQDTVIQEVLFNILPMTRGLGGE